MKTGIGTIFKIVLLAFALIATFIAMKGANTENVQKAFSALGIEPGAPGSPGLQPGGSPLKLGEERRTLCRTRIHAIRFPDGRSVVEEKRGLKLDWTAEEGGKRSSIGYMSVEKWLSLHCQFVARPAPQATEQELVPQTEPKLFVEIDFIDQTQLKLYRSGAVLFAVSDMEDRFISPDLESALKELRILAGFPVDSKP
jgi:hypothetical protein